MGRTKVIIGILMTAVVVIMVLYFSLRYLVVKSFPEYSGTVSAPQLLDAVTIYRDEYGVPHIFAANEHDLFFAQGYVHAQDRLWQMDIARRAGEGRLSEVLGSSTVPFDKMLRTVGFRRIAERLDSAISPTSREVLQAYADGVNEYIRTHKGKYPIEFDMLNYEPEPWTRVHSLMIARLMAWELNISWHVDVVLGELTARFGEEMAKEVFPTYPENAPVIVSDAVSAEQLRLLRGFAAADLAFRDLIGATGTHIGSNAWAVSGNRTEHGRAMLANDPHLGLGVPAKWYEIHLHGGGFNTAGVSLPGAPLVIIGHNPSVAWGLTNVMADDADFYLEQADSLGADRYRYKGEWRDIEMDYDTIAVKDSQSVPIVIRRTVHGPAVNEVFPLDTITQSNLITMRWTGFELSDELLGIYRIDTCRSWSGFLEGVREFTVPGQNFVYADAAGNIGYHPGVRLPIRRMQNPTLPTEGWSGENDWSGFVPFHLLPSAYNPLEGFVATANNKLSNTFPYHISNLWEPPSRIERIRELLRSKEKFIAGDFASFQSDDVSPYAREMVPYILNACRPQEQENDVAMIVNYFRNWNFSMGKDDVPTTLFEVIFNHLIRNMYHDEMGDDLFRQYVFLANIPYRVTMSLLKDSTSLWFDDVTTAEVETRDDIIRRSVRDAVDELRARLGGPMKEWRWGRLHTLTLKHPFGSISVLRPIFNIGPFETGGSGTTVNNGEYSFNDPYAMTLGPSTRQIVDFSDINGALSVIPSGQSGQPLHPYYSDQTPLWKNGQYHSMPLDEEVIASRAKNILYLTPNQ